MWCIPTEKKPGRCGDCKRLRYSDEYGGRYCIILDELKDVCDSPPADCPIVEMPDVNDTPPLDRALEAIEAVYQNHPDDKMTAFLILRYTIEERINDIKDEREAGNDAS